jgi:hypothetical protein
MDGLRPAARLSIVVTITGAVATCVCAASRLRAPDIGSGAWLRRRAADRADAALDRAVRWTNSRPPAGVSGRFSKSFYLDPQNPGSLFRFDMRGLTETHLKV